MRVVRIALSFLLILASSPRLNSQQPIAAPQRDSRSVTVLQRSVAALGGAGPYSSTSGVIAHGILTAAPSGVSGPIVWENAGTEFRYERPGPNGSIVFVSGHGNPAIVDSGNVQQNIVHLAMVTFPWHLPSVVLAAQLNNPNIRVDSIQQVTVNGASAIKILTTDETDSLSSTICKQDWYFDAATLFPVRVDYLAAEVHNALDNAKMTVLLSDYRSVSGLQIPFRIATFFEGQQISDVVLTSVQLNAAIPASDFDVPVTVVGGAQ